MLERFTTFLKESRTELKKVTWPGREEIFNHTLAVLLISAGVAAFLGGLDFAFQWLLNNFVL